MKIGIDIRLIGKKRTGDEVVFFNLVKNLAKINSEHSFELFTDIVENEVLQEIGEDLGIVGKNNFRIVSLPTKNRFSWNFRTLPAYLRKNNLDIYLTQYITPFFVPKSTKIATIIHDISFNFYPQFIKFSDLVFLKTLIPLSLRRADKIIGVSEFTKNEIIKFYKINPEKVDYIHNSISDEFLSGIVSEREQQTARAKYGLPEKYILYLGTLQPRKNIPQLIEAFASIKNDLKGLKLVICGSLTAHNADRKIQETVVKNHVGNDIVFPGFVDEQDKAAIFAAAHVFVFPSFYEGFGIPPLEAMSQGVPVLCSNIPSLTEVAGDGALFFELNNLDGFSKKLYDISIDDNLRSELIQLGKERISFFSWEKSARKILAIFEKM